MTRVKTNTVLHSQHRSPEPTFIRLAAQGKGGLEAAVPLLENHRQLRVASIPDYQLTRLFRAFFICRICEGHFFDLEAFEDLTDFRHIIDGEEEAAFEAYELLRKALEISSMEDTFAAAILAAPHRAPRSSSPSPEVDLPIKLILAKAAGAA